MRQSLCLFVFVLLVYSPVSVHARRGNLSENYATVNINSPDSQNVRMAFYNLENMYDPYDDTTTLDDEFTTSGTRRWTFTRFLLKLDHLAKTLMAIGGWNPPGVIGVTEIENNYVLNKLIYETPLKKYRYRYIHYESTDTRGIDVALLYRPSVFRVLSSRNINILFPNDSVMKTRDILYVRGILLSSDTLNIFINHWPSRRGGFTESVPKRRLVAKTLRTSLDTLTKSRKNPRIIIMGDFNDDPDQSAVSVYLRARELSESSTDTSLINLMIPIMRKGVEGTHKYQGKWAILDQFMVSGNLLLSDKGIRTTLSSVHIFHATFLMEDDSRFLGGKPYRTYSGPRYTGGFSDHLPVYLDVWVE